MFVRQRTKLGFVILMRAGEKSLSLEKYKKKGAHPLPQVFSMATENESKERVLGLKQARANPLTKVIREENGSKDGVWELHVTGDKVFFECSRM